MDSGRATRATRRRSMADDTDADTDTGWCSGRKALRALRVDEWADVFQRRRTGVCGDSVYLMRDFWGWFRLFGDMRRADRGDYLCKSFGWENCCSGFTDSGTTVCSVRLLSGMRDIPSFRRLFVCREAPPTTIIRYAFPPVTAAY